MINTTQTGQQGEEQAARFLEKKGYQILARNFSTPQGELDIIAYYQKTLIFVEVKTRAYKAFGGPLAAVTPAKQKRLALAAAQYIKIKSPKFDRIRFDVICILPGQVQHLENAFLPVRTNL